MSEPSTLELSLLRNFSPLDGLKSENLRALARKTTLRDLGQGRVLFKEGDTDKRTYYLVSGTVDLLTDGHIVGSIKAGTPDARHAIAPIMPRRCTARVATDRIEYVSIDSHLQLSPLQRLSVIPTLMDTNLLFKWVKLLMVQQPPLQK